MPQGEKAKRVIPVSWRRLIPGVASIGIGIASGSVYLNDYANMFMGVVSAVAFAAGLFLVYGSFKSSEAGFTFSKKKYTGRENAIILFAKSNPGITDKAVPVILRFVEIKHPPSGARLHYLKNTKRHYYELFNNLETKKLEPVVLPDKKSFPPEQFQIPAAMQLYKDAIEYSPPTMFQKIAPGVILLGMGIVGLLMIATGG